MRAAAPLSTALLVLLAACGREASVRRVEPVPDEALAPAAWETAWALDEQQTWHEGVVMDLRGGGDTRDVNFAPGVGATVELFAVAPDGAISAAPVGATAVTGADGKFRIGPGPANGWVIRLSKEGTTSTWVGGGVGLAVKGVVMPPPGLTLRVGMRNGHEMKGRVTDETGRPIAGAHVLVTGEAHREDATTDADGRFTANPPRGGSDVEVDDLRYERAAALVSVPDKGPAPDVTLVARRATPVSGWVVAEDGARLAGVLVFCLENDKIRARTDDEGRFQLAMDRRLHLAAVAGGYGWRVSAAPQAGDLEILLHPTTGATGRVVDPDGRPVADARLIGAVFNVDGVIARVKGPKTASDGSFRFTWLPKPWRGAETPARCVATKRGAGETTIVSPGFGDVPTSDATLAFTGSRDVFGRATRADGSPVAGAFVEARWGHWDGGLGPEEIAALGLEEYAAARTDHDGTYRLPQVPLKLRARIRCAIDGVVLERNLEPSPADAPFDFAFEKGRVIAGKVVAPDGSPVQGAVDVRAQLILAQGTEVDRQQRAGADGSFRFESLPPGEYQITAWGNMYDRYGASRVDAGDETVVVTIHQTGTLKFRFTWEGDAAPDAPLALKLEPPGGGAVVHKRQIEPDHVADGVEIAQIDPGTWTLTVAGGTWRGGIERVEVKDAETRTIEVPLTKTLRVAGRLVDADGAPRGRTLVVFEPIRPTKGVVVSAASADDGSLDVVGLLPGRWRASVDAPGAAALRKEFDVVAGPNPPIELRMPPFGAIAVRVSGDDAKGAEVRLADEAGSPVLAWVEGAATPMSQFKVDASGAAKLRGVRTGKVRVQVLSSGSVVKTAEVDVAAGREAAVDAP